MSREAFSLEPREEAGNSRARGSQNARSRTDSPRNEDPAIDRENWQPANRPGATPRKPEALDFPRAHYLGDRAYLLRDSELLTLGEIGTFRAIADADLARLSYCGDTKRMEKDIRRLRQQSLLSERVVPAGGISAIRLFALTRGGSKLVENSRSIPEEQAIYSGFANLREAKHDADLYRLYHEQAEAILHSGGQLTRVILDYELKHHLNRDLASVRRDEQQEQAREKIARRHRLSVVNGKILIPDLRFEYVTADMERRYVDLELATRHYSPAALEEKARAGFSVFARREDASRLRRMLAGREITAEIRSL